MENESMSKMAMLYIASFGRIPDLGGLTFWTNAYAAGMDIDSIANQFITSTEGNSRYPSTYNNIQFLDAIYINVLGRTADYEGKLYWLNALNSGLPRGNFINTIIHAALNNESDDGIILQNKATYGVISASSGIDVATASAKLASITADTKSVESALVFDYAYNLTTGTDMLTGSGGNDTFSGTLSTTQTTDRVIGGEGVDTLRLTGTTLLPALTSIELLVFSGISSLVDISSVAGVTLTTIDGLSSYTAITLKDQTLGLKNVTGGATIDLAYATATSKAVLVLSSVNMELNLSDGEGIAEMSMTFSGSGNTVSLRNSALAPIASIILLGSGSVSLDLNTVDLSALATLDASVNSGGVTIDFDDSLESVLTAQGGNGADAFTFGSGFNAEDNLDGGAGVDTLYAFGEVIATDDATLKNLEKIILTSASNVDFTGQSESFNLTGSSSNDTISLGIGRDTINAGSGNDTIYKGTSGQTDTIDGGAGDDKLIALGNLVRVGDSNLINVESIQLSVASELNLDDQSEGFRIIGSLESDTITFSKGADTFVFEAFETQSARDTLYNFDLTQDKMDFSLFFEETALGEFIDMYPTAVTFSAGLDLTAGETMGVVYNLSRALVATDIATAAAANKIALNDDAKAIVFATKDTDGLGDNTVNNAYDIYTIWDATLATAGTSWQVVRIGVLTSNTEWDATDVLAGTFL